MWYFLGIDIYDHVSEEVRIICWFLNNPADDPFACHKPNWNGRSLSRGFCFFATDLQKSLASVWSVKKCSKILSPVFLRRECSIGSPDGSAANLHIDIIDACGCITLPQSEYPWSWTAEHHHRWGVHGPWGCLWKLGFGGGGELRLSDFGVRGGGLESLWCLPCVLNGASPKNMPSVCWSYADLTKCWSNIDHVLIIEEVFKCCAYLNHWSYADHMLIICHCPSLAPAPPRCACVRFCSEKCVDDPDFCAQTTQISVSRWSACLGSWSVVHSSKDSNWPQFEIIFRSPTK